MNDNAAVPPFVDDVAALIRSSRSLVAFTGAGISTNAGIADFRGKKGIYTTGKYPPSVFDIDVFERDPRVFYAYARDFMEMEKHLLPTFAHRFLAKLEQEGRLAGVVTQNIDGLHQKAGSRSVIEIHGGYGSSHCLNCGSAYGVDALRAKMEAEEVPHCDRCGGVVKPDIVFFGEAVRDFSRAEDVVAGADVLLVIGTSLAVYPAAMLPELVKGTVVVVNMGDVPLRSERTVAVNADIDEFFRHVAAELGMEL